MQSDLQHQDSWEVGHEVDGSSELEMSPLEQKQGR